MVGQIALIITILSILILVIGRGFTWEALEKQRTKN